MQPYRERPDWVRRFNQFGPATGDPRYIVPLDPTELLAQARKATGLEEIGDALWHETFERRMRSIDEDSNANLLGRFLCRAEAIRVLQTRLRLYQDWAENPEILEIFDTLLSFESFNRLRTTQRLSRATVSASVEKALRALLGA